MLRTLDVIIGLVFVFSLLSVVCSAVAEGIEAIVRRRATGLQAGLRRLLEADGTSYVDAFYKHPLIQAFYDANGRRKPSYIPSRSFAIAVLDVLAKSPRVKADALTYIDRLPDDALGNAVRALAKSAGDKWEDTLGAVQGWFDDAMDRVSSAYKRGTHWILLVLGLGVAGTLNADAINIASMLATDPALRESVVDAALRRANAPAPAPSAQDTGASKPAPKVSGAPAARGRADVRPASAPGGSGGGAPQVIAPAQPSDPPAQPAGPAAPAASPPAGGGSSDGGTTAAAMEQLQALSLPIGWSGAKLTQDPRGIPETQAAWLTKILGILVTGFALSLGAPFWFDVLNKVAQLRTATKPANGGR